MGTIMRSSGRDGKIVCEPPCLVCLLRRPRLTDTVPMDSVTGRSKGMVSVWTKGTAPWRSGRRRHGSPRR